MTRGNCQNTGNDTPTILRELKSKAETEKDRSSTQASTERNIPSDADHSTRPTSASTVQHSMRIVPGTTYSSTTNTKNIIDMTSDVSTSTTVKPVIKTSSVAAVEPTDVSSSTADDTTTVFSGISTAVSSSEPNTSLSSPTNKSTTNNSTGNMLNVTTSVPLVSFTSNLSKTEPATMTYQGNESLSTASVTKDVTTSMLPFRNVSDRCKSDNVGGCFWTNVSSNDYNFREAQAYCESHGAIVAVIPNDAIHNALIHDIRSQIPVSWPWIEMWVGMTINSTLGKVTPKNAFYSWYSTSWPYIGSQYESRTNVVLYVERSPTAKTGLANTVPWANYRRGVACWKAPVNTTTNGYSSIYDPSVQNTVAFTNTTTIPASTLPVNISIPATTFPKDKNDMREASSVATDVTSTPMLSNWNESGCISSRFDFTEKDHLHYIAYNGTLPSLTAFTACVWIEPPNGAEAAKGSILSYCAPGAQHCNSIWATLLGSNVQTHLASNKFTLTNVPHIQSRSHLCFVMSTVTGYFHYYLNGTEPTPALRVARAIGEGGRLILGQDQDEPDGEPYHPHDGFYGRMDGFLFWNRVLSEQEIEEMYRSGCNCANDAIVRFNSLNSIVNGNVTANSNHICSQTNV